MEGSIFISVKKEDYWNLCLCAKRLVRTANEVIKISDRKHDAWDALKKAIEEIEKCLMVI